MGILKLFIGSRRADKKNAFVAIDVETANSCRGSICQIGAVRYNNGKIVDEFVTLVNPMSDFSDWNIKVHAITPDMVEDAPTFDEIYDDLVKFIGNDVVVCHSSFDVNALNEVAEDLALDEFTFEWIDSTAIARRVWPEHFAKRGYGLQNICSTFGHHLMHHDALEDAKAVGFIINKALKDSGFDVDGIAALQFEKSVGEQTIDPPKVENLDGNKNGHLVGETITITGSLGLTRAVAGQLAAKAGAHFRSKLTKKTTILVVGKVSLSHMTSEINNAMEQGVIIINEKEFFDLIGQN